MWFAADTEARLRNGVLVDSNTAAAEGGGVFNLGTFDAGDATITGNLAGTTGGGVFTAAGAMSVLSGAAVIGNVPDDTAGPAAVA